MRKYTTAEMAAGFLDSLMGYGVGVWLVDAVAYCVDCPGESVTNWIKRLAALDAEGWTAGLVLGILSSLTIYGGVRMVLLAYLVHRRKQEVWKQKIRDEGRQAERARLQNVFNELGITPPPAVAKILAGNADDNSG